MIFQRAVQREFAQTAAAVFVALVAILATTQLIRLLGQAAGGRIAPEAVLALLGFGALAYLPVLMSLTMFISILMTLSRAYRDSEMVVWFSSGLSLRDFARPVLKFAAPVLVVITVIALFLSPWALNRSLEYRGRMDQRDDLSRITPGVFRESSAGDRIFFVEGVAGEQNQIQNIFVNILQHERLGVMSASKGHLETAANGDRFIVLENGRRYDGAPGTAEYRVMTFERYAVRIETHESRNQQPSAKGTSTVDLLRSPTPANLGELLWRIGTPLAALNLVLLAIPLSFVNPRAGRTNNLIFAVFAYMLYNNLLSLSQAWVVKGKLPFEIGVWAVHLAMFVLLLLLFWRRLSLFSLRRLWR